MEDWQDAVLSSKHMHNGVSRYNGKGSGRSKRNSSFDVRRSFGAYSCKCATWERMNVENIPRSNTAAALHLYRLTVCGQGIVGELSLPGVLEAPVILAGSRKSLHTIIATLSPHNMEEPDANKYEEEEEEEDENNFHDTSLVADNADEISPDKPDKVEQDRIKTFEKNSFRSPKFWLQWSGVPSIASASGSHQNETADQQETATIEQECITIQMGLGYVVFSGNDCRKFKGTISCSKLGWENVAISGYKIASRSESDIPIVWTQTGAAL